MRVIAGTARSIPLKTPAGLETRPTTDRIKETLFNMLQFELPDSVFLDIFAGSGAIGIEALSRGAAQGIFVDSSKAAWDVINQNLTKCGMMDRAAVYRKDAANVSSYYPGRDKLKDRRLIVFMDPPYGKGLEKAVLRALKERIDPNDDATVILEEALEYDISELRGTGFEAVKEKKYKNQKHLFIKREQD